MPEPSKSHKFVEMMNQTDDEMQRLGWTISQGRDFLQETYGVRSRLQLTEEELDNFLLYLQLTDSPVPSPQDPMPNTQ